MIKRIKVIISTLIKLFKRFVLYIILFIFCFITFLLWRLNEPSGNIGDFGLNAFTELIGIFITVALVEKIISKQKTKELLPIKAAYYREIQMLLSRMVSFWAEVYDASVPGDNPQTVSDLFSESSFQKMLTFLNMDGIPNVTPSTNWWMWFLAKGKEFKEEGDGILNRYYTYLDPNLFKDIHYLINDSSIIGGMMNMQIINQLDEREQIPRPRYLGAYFAQPDNNTLRTFLYLYNWSEKTYIELIKEKYEVYRVQIGYVNKKPDIPVSMMKPEVISAQNDKYIDWQNGQKVQNNR